MAKASTQSTKQKAIKSSLVKTGWICTTIPILVQVGLFATEFQLTKAAEQLAIAESYESQANDLIMRSNSLLTQSWAALLMRSARGQARSNSAIMQNVHQLRENISQLKAIPRQGSSEILQTIVRELEGQVDILETNEKSISSQTSESHDLDQGGNFAAMMDRIHKLRKESIAGINMLGRMTRAMDEMRLKTIAKVQTTVQPTMRWRRTLRCRSRASCVWPKRWRGPRRKRASERPRWPQRRRR